MFDDPMQKDTSMISFEETYQNLAYLNKSIVQKLNEQGLTKDYEISQPPQTRNIRLSPTMSQLSSYVYIPRREKAYEFTRCKISELLKECHASRCLIKKDVLATNNLQEVGRQSEIMKEAFVRYEDGKPFFRDLKVMEIVEDMQILDGIDKEILTRGRIALPPIMASSLKKYKNRGKKL